MRGCIREAGKRPSPSELHHPDRFKFFGLLRLTHRSYTLRAAWQKEQNPMATEAPDRKRMIEFLNDDLSREYQAVIAYTVYSNVLKGAQYMHIASELQKHASEELDHAMKIANQIDYFGGMPTGTPKPVKLSDNAEEMLRADLENERVTIANYRTRVRQADAMGEFALSEVLREILVQEQDHLTDLATALGIDAPDPGVAM
jgi:bacterioferritin